MRKKNKNTKFYKIFKKDTDGKDFMENFGINSSWKWYNDPRQFFISLSRYKFVSKILKGKKNVLEIGCSDGFNSRIVKQEVKNLDLCDTEEKLINNAKKILKKKWKMNFFIHDFLKKNLNKKYDGIYFLDVLEHIPAKKEKLFLKNILRSLKKEGILIIGIPSLEFQTFSRPKNISGHINCKTSSELNKTLKKFFHNVIIFSMNDEMVHTGFEKMSCYFFALCVNKKSIK